MCGFAGYVGSVENREEVLEHMMDTIIHRGPDSSGKFVDEDAALGFRRLSIIDLSSVGDQPLYNEDRSKVLVFKRIRRRCSTGMRSGAHPCWTVCAGCMLL